MKNFIIWGLLVGFCFAVFVVALVATLPHVPEYIKEFKAISKEDDFRGKMKTNLNVTSSRNTTETASAPQFSIPFVYEDRIDALKCYIKDKEFTNDPSTISNFARLGDSEKINLVLEALSPLMKKCLIKEAYDYWNYEYCHLRRIKQYHVDIRDTVSIIVGRASDDIPESVAAMISFIPFEYSQLSQGNLVRFSYSKGDPCPINSCPRKAIVDFKCNPNLATSQIEKFTELKTCEYYLLIETPLLCKIDWFLPSEAVQSQYVCSLTDPASIKNTKFLRFIAHDAEVYASLTRRMSENRPSSPFASITTNSVDNIPKKASPFSSILNILNSPEDAADLKILFKTPDGQEQYLSASDFLEKVLDNNVADQLDTDDLLNQLLKSMPQKDGKDKKKKKKKSA